MSKNVSTSIQYITVFPKSKDRWKYYINDNFKDSHTIHTDDLKKFVNSRIRPPAIRDSIEMISKYFDFIVDIPNNKVYRLLPNQKGKLKTLRMKSIGQFLNPKQARKSEEIKNKKINTDYNDDNDLLLKRYVQVDQLTNEDLSIP